MSTPELDRCPFCRGEAELVEDYPVDYWGECTQCKSHGAPSYNKREAIAAWNRRAGPPAPAPEGWAETARAALEPFADVSGEGDEDFPDDTPVTVRFGRTTHYALTLGDFRRAVRAMISAAPAAHTEEAEGTDG